MPASNEAKQAIKALLEFADILVFDDTEEQYEVKTLEEAIEAYDSTGEGQFGVFNGEGNCEGWVMMSQWNDGNEQVIDYHTSLDPVFESINFWAD